MAWSATRYDIERLENVLAYLRLKDRLEKRHRHKWVAIARGRLVAVAKTGKHCIEKAQKAAPRVTHRFVFRVETKLPDLQIRETTETECKDEKECARNLINKIALGKRIQAAGGKLEDDYEKNQTCITLKGKTTCWKWQGKGGVKGFEENGSYIFLPCIEVTVDEIGTGKKKTICALLDSGKSGAFIFLEPGVFLDVGGSAEGPDDTMKAKTAGGDIAARMGFVSFEIPKADFSMEMAMAITNKDDLKTEVERRKKEEEKKKETKDEKK